MICECGGQTWPHYRMPDTEWCQRCGLLQCEPKDLRGKLDREQRLFDDGKRRYEHWASAQAERIVELAKQLAEEVKP